MVKITGGAPIGERQAMPSVQKYLPIGEIRDNTVIMKDGTLTAALLVSSVNFALKNEDEQNAIIGSYVNFLNNINFPLQIVIQSRELNVEGYLNDLRDRERAQTNELLKAQTTEYIDFVGQLVSMGKIMNKRFYVVVPYNALSDNKKGFFSRFLELFNPVSFLEIKDDRFNQMRKELSRRVDSIISGLESMGLNVAELDTQSLIELFYNTYNPEISDNQALEAIKEIRVK